MTMHSNSSNWLFTLNSDMMDSKKYLKMVELFIDKGHVPRLDSHLTQDRPWENHEADPLMECITTLMTDRLIQQKVLPSKIRREVFYTKVGQFINDCVHDVKFMHQRSYTEIKQSREVLSWPADMKRAMWQTLVESISTKLEPYGFDGQFFHRLFSAPEAAANPDCWEKLSADWREALRARLRNAIVEKLEFKKATLLRSIENALKKIDEAIEKFNMTELQALEAWNMTTGPWSETEFEKKLAIVRTHDRFPEITEIVNIMGRHPSANGRSLVSLATGSGLKLEHSSGSDIEGISIGNDLNALLPTELAQYSDDNMQTLFAYKYVTKSLQTFRYKSETSKPSRKLSFVRAVRQGPMIVCIDTSASMYGMPQQIEQSLLGRLEMLAEELSRPCYLIDFSVSVRAIDLMARRRQRREARLGNAKDDYTFERGHLPFIGGGTSSRKMLDTLFATLDNEAGQYVNADVLVISDFLMPIDQQADIRRIKAYQQSGTRFYALHITTKGQDETSWSNLFDRLYTIRYRVARRY